MAESPSRNKENATPPPQTLPSFNGVDLDCFKLDNSLLSINSPKSEVKGSLPISPAKRPLEDPVYSSPTSRSRKFSPTKLTFNEEEHAATTPARKQVNCTKLETIKDNLKSLTIDDLSQSIDQTMTNIEKLNEKV